MDSVGKIIIYTNDQNISIDETDNIKVNNCQLQQNYPNPFNPETTIKYSLNNSIEKVSLKIFNSNGKIVKEFDNLNPKAGSHTVLFKAQNLNSGVYFYSLILNNIDTTTKKMILIK